MDSQTPRRGAPPGTVAVLAGLLLAACGSPDTPGTSEPEVLPPPGAPITGLPAGAWTWVGFPDASCDDGTPTGIGVNPGTGTDLVVFLNGGGACWDYLTCFVYNTAAHGPFGAAEFAQLQAALGGTLFDRTLAGNPYADATQVFVPYCTGDVHSGNHVATYTGGGAARTVHHVGHANVVAFARRLAATWPSPRKLVISGSSAGGFGALVNYDTFRHYWPSGEAYLVDDSGPPVGKGGIPQVELDAWFASWRMDRVLDPLCGPPCRTDLSAGLAAVARKYPNDRLALLSSLQDDVIAAYFFTDGPRLEASLLALSAQVIDPAPNARHFYVAGTSHTMLGNPAAFAQGVPLLQWLGQQLDGDPAWTSRKP